MIGTNAGLGGFGAAATAGSKSKQSAAATATSNKLPTLGSLATVVRPTAGQATSTSAAAASAEGKETVKDSPSSEEQLSGVSSSSSTSTTSPSTDTRTAEAARREIDDSPSFVRSSPSSTVHNADDTNLTCETYVGRNENNANDNNNNDGPLPTPSPLAAALAGTSGQAAPSPIRTLQDPWTATNDSPEFADLSCITDADLNLTQHSIVNAKSVLVGDIGGGDGNNNTYSSGEGFGGQKLTFASTSPSIVNTNGGDNNDVENDAEVLLKAATQAEQTLLSSLGNSDPTSALHEHYQSVDKSDAAGSKQPTYRDVQRRDGRGILTGWWRSVLSCPMTEEEFYSGLPRSVLLGGTGDNGGNTSENNEWENILTKLGEYSEFDDGYLYFKSKKGARKAAALSAFEANIIFRRTNTTADGGSTTRIMFHCRSEAVSSSLPVSDKLFEESPGKLTPEKAAMNVDTEGAPPLPSAATGTRRLGYTPRSSYPVWVERLYRNGVDPTSIEIKFREKIPLSADGQWPRQFKYISKDHPTQLCCVMRIASPLKLTAVSMPFQSRSDALDSVSLLVDEEIRRQDTHVAFDNNTSDESGPNWEAKEGLVRSAPEKTATFVFPPPACFIAPIEESTSTELFAYELNFTTTAGKAFVPSAMGLSPRAVTKMAIVFGQDIFGDEEVSKGRPIETTIELPTRNGAEKVKVTLCNRAAIRLSTENASDHIRTMKRFNTVLCDWKRYGFAKWSRSHGSVSLKDPPQWSQGNTPGYHKRTCMIAPLQCQVPGGADGKTLQLDWDLMNRVIDFELQPYYLTVGGYWRIPIFGRIRSHYLALLFALLAVTFAAFSNHVHLCTLTYSDCVAEMVQKAPVESMWLAFHALAFLLMGKFPPKKTAGNDDLLNRFLLQSVGKFGIFVMQAEGTKVGPKRNAFSTYLKPSDEEGKSPCEQSFYDLFLKRYATRLCYANEPMLSTIQVKKHAKQTLLQAQPLDVTETTHLPPELVYILPCPRDILYMCGQHLEKIMVPLERSITLLHIESRIKELKAKNSMEATTVGTRNDDKKKPMPSLFSNLDEGESLVSLLDKATGLFPSITYQRLEFLGDKFLNYFLSIDLLARNANLKWDSEDLGEILVLPTKNEALGKAALRIGLSRLLGVGGSKWKSAYGQVAGQNVLDSSTSSSQLIYNGVQSNELSQGTLSDVVESLLAVAFMSSGGDGSVVVGLLNELELPVKSTRGEEMSRGFHGLSACLGGPYPFELQKKWNEQILAVGTTMIVNHEIDDKLECGFKSLCDILESKASRNPHNELSSARTKILLRCALFDDSLEFEESVTAGSINTDNTINDSLVSILTRGSRRSSDTGSLDRTISTLDGLDLVGILRDNLFFVGNYALNMCISIEVYKRFPTSQPRDLTLLCFCAFTDEVMAYILVKNKLSECLYDQNSSSAAQFWLEMNLADKRGEEIWEDNGGWILGGIDDFCQRIKSSADDAKPRYPGLAGGLFTGKQSKLDKELTEDRAFSMKALCGALVLGIGMEAMWSLIGPLFEEVLLLSPDELRLLYSDNSVVRQGRK